MNPSDETPWDRETGNREGIGRSGGCSFPQIVGSMLVALGSLVGLAALAGTPPTGPAPPVPARSDRLTILYTTETNGFLQACGCSKGQVGGLARRASLLHRLGSRGDALLIDGGNLADDLPRSEAVLDALKLMRYQAIGLNRLEMDLGERFLAAARPRELPLLALQPPKGDGTRAWLLTSAADRKIAIVALQTLDPAALTALRRVVRESEGRPDLLVVLSPAVSPESDNALVQVLQNRERSVLVLGTRARATEGKPRLTTSHGIPFVPAAQDAAVGVVEVSFTASAPTFRHRFETITAQENPDLKVQDVVSAYYRRQAEALQGASLEAQLGDEDLPYESANRCATCHPTQVRLWKVSRHARATATLKEKERLVGECLTCHSELFVRTGKLKADAATAWRGVECATCHGDGILHTALRDRQSIQRTVAEGTCRKCHTSQRDPRFDYSTYLQRIRHW
jgi:Cytochrome c554 and c-prime